MLTDNPAIFFAIIALLALSIHLYLWARLVRSTTSPGRWRRVGTGVIVTLGLVGVIGFAVTRTVGVDAWWLAWAGYGWIALMFYLLLALLVLEIPRLVLTLWWRGSDPGARTEVPRPRSASPSTSVATATVGSPTPQRPVGGATTSPRQTKETEAAHRRSGPANPERRLLLSRVCALTACTVAAGVTGYGLRTAFSDLRTTRVRIPLATLDPRLSGFRIAVVSDTHFGPFIHREMAERIVRIVDREQPDMVVILGDLADGTVAEIGRDTEPLRQLRSRHGTYFVTGNHEYSSGVEEWVDQVRELGIRPLLNERVEITSGGAAFDLAGVNDVMAPMYDKQGPDFASALDGRDPARFSLLLAHQPVQLHTAVKYGVDLQLSGHTHGGQTAPFDRLVGLQQPVVAGLAKKQDTSIFVTRGAGFFGPPVRAGIPPEMAIVELQARG
ncbi:metallophosphoesterase [Verrucosispora sp. WMMA2044]|uniref:metallophosphoesterase n=1 Tax=Verrucosispora sp. WMMA2044 TaxID=3016419 RepID=UPI00248C2DC8|nr:metallophosphoesterase [Verrucosispora sp. WMMA2044]WBB50439.1 metallophosphoesterase [Verrucosispora sp. WMMA2044]